jgi:hypothetical protein
MIQSDHAVVARTRFVREDRRFRGHATKIEWARMAADVWIRRRR